MISVPQVQCAKKSLILAPEVAEAWHFAISASTYHTRVQLI